MFDVPSRLKFWLQFVCQRADQNLLRDQWNALRTVERQRELQALINLEEEATLREMWELAHRPEILDYLSYTYLRRRDAANALPGQRIHVERMTGALRGMIGGALAVGAVLRRDTASLQMWLPAACAAWSGETAAEGELPALTLQGETPAACLRNAFAQLRGVNPAAPRTGEAQAWTLALLSGLPDYAEPPSMIQPVVQTSLLMYRPNGGYVCRLRVEKCESGQGDCFPDPVTMALLPMTEAFLAAARSAWTAAQRFRPDSAAGERFDVCWRIESIAFLSGDVPILEGGSHGAALAVAFAQLLRGELLDERSVISATITDDGKFGPVTGVREKAIAAFEHCDAQNRPLLERLVLAPEPGSLAQAQAVALNLRRDPDKAVFSASGLAEFLPEASGMLEQLRRFLQQEPEFIREDAGLRMQRNFARWNDFEAFCVPVRVACGEAAERDTARRGMEAALSLTASRTVEWETLRLRLQRAIVLGAPGYGKTTLLWHEAGMQCRAALESLLARQSNAASCRFAAFLRASDLADALPPVSAEPGIVAETSARLLNARHSLQPQFVGFLTAKILSGDCLLVLDALDEVDNLQRGRLHEALRNLAQKSTARLLLSARREGYARDELGFAREEELEALPFENEQMRRTIKAWFGAEESAGEALWSKIKNSDNLRYALRSPLLLRIACKVALNSLAQRRGLPDWNRRVELYKAFLEDLLLQWLNRDAKQQAMLSATLLDFASDVALHWLEQETGFTAGREKNLPQIINEIQKEYPALMQRELTRDLMGAGILMNAGLDGLSMLVIFTHRTFGEYLAAAGLANRIADKGWAAMENTLKKRVDHPDWHEVIIFLAGLIQNPLPLLKLLADEEQDDVYRHRLGLAVQCLPEVMREPESAAA